jgi:hypothetical protein
MSFEIFYDFYENDIIAIPKLDSYKESDKLVLDEQVFVSFLHNILSHYSTIFNFCFPFSDTYIMDHFITITIPTMSIELDNGIISTINKACLNKSLVILPIKLITFREKDEENGNLFDGHSNVVIIDNDRQTIEYFEPHGIQYLNTISEVVDIPNLVTIFIKSTLPFTKSYVTVNSAISCMLGVQSLQGMVNIKSGHCLAWSLYFITLRILNQSNILNNETVSEYLNRYLTSQFSPTELDSIVRKFISLLHSLPVLNNISYFSTYTADILPYFNFEKVEERINYLASLYFEGLRKETYEYIKLIFEELVSYKTFPRFHEILYHHFNLALLDLQMSMQD